MRALTPKEKRTVRIAAVLVGVYLALLYGARGWRHLEARRGEHADLRVALQEAEGRLVLERERQAQLASLRASLGIDLQALAETSLVTESLAAIQKTAQESGIRIDESKEVQGRYASAEELARFQLRGRAEVGAASRFLHALPRLGYPLVVESLHLETAGHSPGNVGFSMGVALLRPPPGGRRET